MHQKIGSIVHVMNIFATDDNPIIAARNLCDKHTGGNNG